ncbi:hypothetical protein [Pseudomonas putida]|uniref:Uncharacterized protein n=1 Tax=Pseudomonas putida TaxID=303 RepID=A0A8I1JHM8_PSEPU|nr:hypothetical protein [Pseudomonas putida]MBI6882846.1 hypothetical protein [Pseudomonas putida]
MSHGAELEECIEKLIKLCSKEKVPVICAIQDAPRSYRTLVANEQLAVGQQLKLMRMLIKAGDLDLFLTDVIRDAQHNGHKSLFLRAMGIPEDPKV